MASTTTLKLSEELKARICALVRAAGDAALREYRRTGIAYALEDVEGYILARAEGKNAPHPKPVKRAVEG